MVESITDLDHIAVDKVDGWGWCGVAARSGRLIASTIGQSSAAEAAAALQASLPGRRAIDAQPARPWLELLRERLAGAAGSTPGLDLEGTDFQRKIWRACQLIPKGETRTYGWVAQSAGYPARKYARAAGAALGSNPALVFVPCHRVVSANGEVGGYAAGIDLKRRLLEMESKQGIKA
ncbi:MAG: MGMT family protein [Chloroflexi bacterium]|nr:MGMT family protein [Chloroflexota bacterium]MCY3937611.1 MGMT family protein [Chloroflexota bacterium]